MHHRLHPEGLGRSQSWAGRWDHNWEHLDRTTGERSGAVRQQGIVDHMVVAGRIDLGELESVRLDERLDSRCHNTQRGLVDCLHHTVQIDLLVGHVGSRQLGVVHSCPVLPVVRTLVVRHNLVLDSLVVGHTVVAGRKVAVAHNHRHIVGLDRKVAVDSHPAVGIDCRNRKGPTSCEVWRCEVMLGVKLVV